MPARPVYAVVHPSVCLSACLSVCLSVHIAPWQVGILPKPLNEEPLKQRHTSPKESINSRQWSWLNLNKVTPNGGSKCKWQLSTNNLLSLSRKRRGQVSIKKEKEEAQVQGIITEITIGLSNNSNANDLEWPLKSLLLFGIVLSLMPAAYQLWHVYMCIEKRIYLQFPLMYYCNFTFPLYNCHFVFLSYCFILYYCLTCMFTVLILPACKWLAPFAADVWINSGVSVKTEGILKVTTVMCT